MQRRQADRWLTTAEAAVVMGITTRALERLRGAGRGPVFTRVGRYPKYRLSHVLAYLEARSVVGRDE
ncbi:MAG: helix-turn-helix transcriptional regulator [Microthrixaceae bacterium]